MKKRIPLQTKLLYSMVTIIVVAISVVGYYGYSQAKDVYVEKIKDTERNDIGSTALSIEEKISVMKEDANFIANFYAMQQLLNWQSMGVDDKVEIWDQAAKDTLVSMIDLKDFYYKLRILDLEGMEKINVFFDQKTQQIVVQDENQLQDRSKERYFLDAQNLKAGEISVSQMELNMEFGKIIYPHVPIVHFTAAIYDNNGQKRGYAVINAYAKNIMSSLNKEKQSFKKRYLIDNKGYYLFNEDENKLWGWQLNHAHSFKSDNPELFDVVSKNREGMYILDEKHYTYKRIYPDIKNKKNYWVVLSELEEDKVFASLNNFERLFYIILALTVLLILVIVNVLMKKFISPLSVVTQQISSLSQGEVVESKIEYGSNDEISDLINASKQLVENIQSTVEQTKNVSLGDFSKRLEPNSKNDVLSYSINEMTDRLQESANIAKKLSLGDIDTNISVYNSKDTLAHALSALVEYFKQITAIAESISVGNYNVSFKPVSNDDRLGYAIESMIETLKQVLAQANSIIEGDYSKNIEPKSDDDKLGFALQKMTKTLSDNELRNQKESWLKDGLNQLGNTLSGIENIK